MYGSFIVRVDGSRREVKNLGWLLRHWRDVDHIHITTQARAENGSVTRFLQPAAVLTARMRDGTRYVTGWASLEVLINWLHRPVFYCTTVDVDGAHGVVRPKSGACYTSDSGSGRFINRAVASDHPWQEAQP